jgi:hypothetical protein
VTVEGLVSLVETNADSISTKEITLHLAVKHWGFCCKPATDSDAVVELVSLPRTHG